MFFLLLTSATVVVFVFAYVKFLHSTPEFGEVKQKNDLGLITTIYYVA